MNTSLTLSDIPHSDGSLELADGFTLKFKTSRDECQGPPWKECDGHGEVSEWTTRDKRPGERVLSSDRRSKRFYDFAGAVAIAKRDGWDAPPYKTGTKGEIAVRAAEADFEFLRGWCNDEWQYIVVSVDLLDADGCEVDNECIGGVESRGDYWRELALENAETLISRHEKETLERAEWEARDTATA